MAYTYNITESDIIRLLDLSGSTADYEFTDDIQDGITVVKDYVEPEAPDPTTVDYDVGERLNRVAARLAAHFALETVTGATSGSVVTRESELDLSIEYATEGVIPTNGDSVHWRRAVLLDPSDVLVGAGGGDLKATVI